MPLSSLTLLLDGVTHFKHKPWPRLKDESAEQMFLSFAQLDTQKLKHIRKFVGCHFSTLLGVIEAEASKRFLQNKSCKDNKSKLFNVMYPVAVPKHPVVFGGPLQNHT